MALLHSYKTLYSQPQLYPTQDEVRKRTELLLDRRKQMLETAEKHPKCKQFRSWLQTVHPLRMWLHERDTLPGMAMELLGFHPEDTGSQVEWIIWLKYHEVQAELAAEFGHCFPECREEFLEDGNCKHTARPCVKQCYAQVLEYIGIINQPEVCRE